MKFFSLKTPAALALLTLLASCSSTVPTAKQLDLYYEKAGELAQPKIAALDQQLARGEIDQSTYDSERAAIDRGIAKKATEMAWAKHELVESQNRALGIPTGDTAVSVRPPAAGGQDSFYRRAGDAGDPFANVGNPSTMRQNLPENDTWRGYSRGSVLGPEVDGGY
jgi:hypothetical protein